MGTQYTSGRRRAGAVVEGVEREMSWVRRLSCASQSRRGWECIIVLRAGTSYNRSVTPKKENFYKDFSSGAGEDRGRPKG
jgi:hypothetical protein